jgi:hypothetical protein
MCVDRRVEALKKSVSSQCCDLHQAGPAWLYGAVFTNLLPAKIYCVIEIDRFTWFFGVCYKMNNVCTLAPAMLTAHVHVGKGCDMMFNPSPPK